MTDAMQAYDEAQAMLIVGKERDEIEIQLIRNYPDLSAQGLIPTILRRAQKDLAAL